jgi:hypothetical protein
MRRANLNPLEEETSSHREEVYRLTTSQSIPRKPQSLFKRHKAHIN